MKTNKILKNLIYLTIFLIPLYLVKVKILFFPTNVLEMGIIFLAGLHIFINIEKPTFEKFSEYKKYIYIILLILVGMILSALFNGNTQESWGIIKGWILIPMVFFLICWENIKQDEIRKIFNAYFLSASVVAIISLGYFILGKTTYDGRLTGFFTSPNYLAMYLSPAIFIFLFQEKKNKIKWIVSLGLIILVLFLTYSYASWLAILSSLLLVFFWQDRNKVKKSFYYQSLILIFIAILLVFSQADKDKFNSLVTLNERSSLASRIMVWKASSKMIENNLWFGIGAGNFQDTYLEYQKFYPPYLNWAVSHPNNLYLTWWLYGGLLGFASFLALVFFFFRDVLTKKEPQEVLFMSLGIMLVILIHGIFDTTYFKNDLAIVFWLNLLVLKIKD